MDCTQQLGLKRARRELRTLMFFCSYVCLAPQPRNESLCKTRRSYLNTNRNELPIKFRAKRPVCALNSESGFYYPKALTSDAPPAKKKNLIRNSARLNHFPPQVPNLRPVILLWDGPISGSAARR